MRPTGTCSKTVRARRRAFSLPARSAATSRAKRARAPKTSWLSSEAAGRRTGGRPSAASAIPCRTRRSSLALAVPDGEDEEGDEEAGAERDRTSVRRNGASWASRTVLADREPDEAGRHALGSDAARDVDERDRPRSPSCAGRTRRRLAAPRRSRDGRRDSPSTATLSGVTSLSARTVPSAAMSVTRAPVWRATARTFSWGSGAGEEVGRELAERWASFLQIAARPLGDGAVEDAAEDGREETAEDEPGENRDERTA